MASDMSQTASSDWAGSVTDWKSTSRCCFSLGSTMIAWCSRKKMSVVLNNTEAKYIAACLASREAMWLRKMLSGLFYLEMDATCIYCDN